MDRIDALAIFVAVAEERSFVAAARRLRRSATAVTRAVAGLESRLGTRLFTRTTRAVVLTPAGERHLSPSRRILAEFDALLDAAADAQHAPRGSLVVTASVVFGRLHVTPVVTEFLQHHPAIDVRLLLADDVRPLVEGGIDVGVRIAHLPDSSLKAIRVGTVRRALYASPSYLAANGEPREPSDLAQHACIAFTGSTPDPERWSFGRGRNRRTVNVRPRLTVNLAEPAIDAACAGLGVVCVLSYMVDHLVAAERLQPLLRTHEPPPIPVHVVYPAGGHLPAPTRLFLDHTTRALKQRLAGK